MASPARAYAKIFPSRRIEFSTFSCSSPGHCTRMMKWFTPEPFLPARDLLLHRHLVADDEPVARHLLERHGRRSGFPCPTRHRNCTCIPAPPGIRPSRWHGSPDIAFARDRELVRRLARLAQRRAIHRHQRSGGAERGGVGDQPRIADVCGAPHRGLHQARHPHRRPALLQRPQADAVVLHRVEPALERDAILGPQPSHQRDALGEPWRAMPQRDAERVELPRPVAKTNPKHELPADSTRRASPPLPRHAPD